MKLEAKKRLIDSLGCAIGAFREDPVRMARRWSSRTTQQAFRRSSGRDTKTSPDMATFVNGIMIRYFDYNDTYLSKEPAHPSDNISACLAVGEQEGASGKDLLSGDGGRLRGPVQALRRGRHQAQGMGPRLLRARLQRPGRREADGAIAGEADARRQHLPQRAHRDEAGQGGELSEWKGCSFANAARNAVFSAMLAGQRDDRASPIFEGEMGFFKQVSGPFELDVRRVRRRGGGPSSCRRPTSSTSLPSTTRRAQSGPPSAARRKVGRHRTRCVKVEVETHEAGYTILSKDKEKWTPSTKETADHSLPYMVGMALLRGKVDNSTYSARNIRDPRVLAFLRKIKVTEDEELTAMYPKHIANRVTLQPQRREDDYGAGRRPQGSPEQPDEQGGGRGEVQEPDLRVP